ncbi:DUF998 domain-containing protein [Shewanella sp. 125m-7]
MLGIFGQVLGLVLSIVMFEHFDGQGYSFLNHTLSELGSYGHSRYAVIVNGGLFFGGLCVVLFCLLSLQLGDSVWRYPFFISLGLTYLAFAATGLFPINVYHLHTIAIKYFFIFGCCSLMFYATFQFMSAEPTFSVLSHICGAFAFLSMAAFLLLPLLALNLTEGNGEFFNEMLVDPSRPEMWWPAIVQWIGVATFLLWSALVVKDLNTRYR